jgi:Zincin-like metallopeptidase
MKPNRYSRLPPSEEELPSMWPPKKGEGRAGIRDGSQRQERAHHRLDRNFGERFGREALAIEEAVAELTASYVLADLGIAHHPRPDHAAYIASWLRIFRNNPRAIFIAASKAQAAADWIHAQQPQATEPAIISAERSSPAGATSQSGAAASSFLVGVPG